MKIFNKVILFLFFVSYSAMFAENPPPLPAPPGDGGDTGTPGAPASPIDMYLYLLVIVAVGFMVYYHHKTRKSIV
ncbi:signal peptidase [Kaistella carnis]|uniref:Signal peptidase n=1 Tax=Kaistella carnis TaxID=1241979 RepID=A0A3G8XWF8_9FLAO|nr:signal peptidase [Kaistella carnis]AZI33031.1 signal peptidase [Kaistella carnis]